MKTNLKNSTEPNSLGGSDIIISMMKQSGIMDHIDKHLGSRSPRAEYSYAEAIISWFSSICCGSQRLENVNSMRGAYKNHPILQKGISPDTLSYIIKELSVTNIEYEKVSNKPSKHRVNTSKTIELPNETNTNRKLNRLLVSLAIQCGLLVPSESYILDYDTTKIISKTKGGRYIYGTEGKRGYQPAVAMIKNKNGINVPVYFENRNGDSSPKFKLSETIEDAIDILKEYNINIHTLRVDGAAFSTTFVQMANKLGIRFITRASAPTVKKGHKFVYGWKYSKKLKVELGTMPYSLGGINGRIVVIGSGECERGIFTNDITTPNEEIVQLYNERGDSENLFKDMKQHFGWKFLGARKFNYNSTYLGLQLVCYTLYKYTSKKVAQVFKPVKANMVLFTFKTKFINVTTKWVDNTLQFINKQSQYYPTISLFENKNANF